MMSQTTEKLDFKQILPVFVILLVDLLGLTIIIPLLPLYAASYGASPWLIGLLGAAYPAMQFIGAPILGGLSDRYGRRPILLVSQVGTFIGFILLGFANGLPILFLSRLVDGISGANIATAQAVITDSTTEKTRTQGLGLVGAAFGLGFIIGPIIAFVTLAATGGKYPWVAFVAAAFSLASIVLTFFWLPESLPAEKRGQPNTRPKIGLTAMWHHLQQPVLGYLLALMFFQQFAFGGYENFLSLFTLSRLGMGARDNAALFVVAGILIVLVQGYFVGRWSRQYGERWLITVGLVVLGLGLVLSAITPTQVVPWYDRAKMQTELAQRSAVDLIAVPLPAADANKSWLGLVWLVIALVPTALAGGVLQPAINSLLTKGVPKVEAGSILGVSAAFFSAANALTPLILGGLYQTLGSTAPFLTGGLILWVLWAISTRVLPKTQTTAA
jgi:DHA1 family tetracycline resistance protein-like MFS transporter